MLIFNRSILLAATVAILALPLEGRAQTAATSMPANYIKVDAPFAQHLIVETKERHPEIVKLGLHATPPSMTDNAIIACDIPSKVGKKSSAPDMEKIAMNKPIAVRVEKDGIYDLLLPITDAKGRDFGKGFIVMEVPFNKASSEADALKIGVVIRDEVQAHIPSKATLYKR
jgi:hypothetical protein